MQFSRLLYRERFLILLMLICISLASSRDRLAFADDGGTMSRGIEAYDAEEFQTAIRHFQLHLDGHANCSVALANLGRCHQKLNQYENSLHYYDMALRLSNYGDDADEALQLKCNDYIGRGDLRQELGQFEAAVDDYRNAMQVPQRSSSFYYQYGQALLFSDHYNEAVTELNKALGLQFKPRWRPCFQKARALSFLGERDQAIDFFRKAIEDAPAEPDSYLARAMFHLCSGFPDEALLEARTDISRDVPLDDASHAMLIVFHFAKRMQYGSEEAQRVTRLYLPQCNRTNPIYSAISYLSGDLSAESLYALASGAEQMTVVQSVFAMESFLDARRDEARERIDWLKANGDRRSLFFDLAVNLQANTKFKLNPPFAPTDHPLRQEVTGSFQRPYISSAGTPQFIELPQQLSDLPELGF